MFKRCTFKFDCARARQEGGKTYETYGLRTILSFGRSKVTERDQICWASHIHTDETKICVFGSDFGLAFKRCSILKNIGYSCCVVLYIGFKGSPGIRKRKIFNTDQVRSTP